MLAVLGLGLSLSLAPLAGLFLGLAFLTLADVGLGPPSGSALLCLFGLLMGLPGWVVLAIKSKKAAGVHVHDHAHDLETGILHQRPRFAYYFVAGTILGCVLIWGVVAPWYGTVGPRPEGWTPVHTPAPTPCDNAKCKALEALLEEGP